MFDRSDTLSTSDRQERDFDSSGTVRNYRTDNEIMIFFK